MIQVVVASDTIQQLMDALFDGANAIEHLSSKPEDLMNAGRLRELAHTIADA